MNCTAFLLFLRHSIQLQKSVDRLSLVSGSLCHSLGCTAGGSCKPQLSAFLFKITDNRIDRCSLSGSRPAGSVGGGSRSGGFSGKGFLEGTQTKFNFVPEQSTDFIFCTVGEEWGFLGSVVVLTLLCLLILRLMRMGERQQEPFGRIYCYCVAAILLFHVLVNVGMTIGLMPVMGIPLPFMSYGGSSLIAFTILLFIAVRLDASTRQFSVHKL